MSGFLFNEGGKRKKEVYLEAQRKAEAVSLHIQSQPRMLHMTRKDSEKDSERPHYYSQFWLDIAAGRRTIGGPRPEDAEATEPELEPEIAEPMPQRRPGRVSEPATSSDALFTANGHREEVTRPVHPVIAEEEDSEIEEEPVPEVEELNDAEYQEDLPIEDEDIPDMDLNVDDEEEEEALEEEEEDEDMNWGRGRKKPKPIRPTKAPVKKPGKPRRGF
jgi:hypothetical protein